MIIRSGMYGIYKGNEYRVAEVGNGMEIILDEPDIPLPKGFYRDKSCNGEIMYCKKIRKEELEEIYGIKTYAVYLGRKRSIIGGVDGELTLTGDTDEQSLGFKMFDRDAYVKTEVSYSEIEEFIEEKEYYDINSL